MSQRADSKLRQAAKDHPEDFQADEGEELQENLNDPEAHGYEETSPSFGAIDEKLPNDIPEEQIWWLKDLDSYPEFKEQWRSTALTRTSQGEDCDTTNPAASGTRV